MACLLQQLPAMDAKRLGGLSSRGVVQGRVTRAAVTTPGFWATRSAGRPRGGQPWVVGARGGQPCSRRGPGRSALWSSGPGAVSPVVVGARGGQPCGSGPRVVSPADVACCC